MKRFHICFKFLQGPQEAQKYIGEWHNNVWIWHFDWKVELSQDQDQLRDDMMSHLVEVEPIIDEPDCFIWKLEQDSIFSVRTCFIIFEQISIDVHGEITNEGELLALQKVW